MNTEYTAVMKQEGDWGILTYRKKRFRISR